MTDRNRSSAHDLPAATKLCGRAVCDHPGAGPVLDLREEHYDFAITQGRPTTVPDPVSAHIHGGYAAILRDGRIRIYARSSRNSNWIEMKDMTVESARRLRDALDSFLADPKQSALPASWRDLDASRRARAEALKKIEPEANSKQGT